MLVINNEDRVSKMTGDYFVHNGLRKHDCIHNPEHYIARILHLKQQMVLALYDKKHIIVGEAYQPFTRKERRTHDIFVFWYDSQDYTQLSIDNDNRTTTYLCDVFSVSDHDFVNTREAVLYYAGDIYKALVEKKIIFEVDYD